MKSKQVLDVQQMQHLQELGLELDYNTMLLWIVDERGKDNPLLCIFSEAVDYVDFSHYCLPAYTLQDVLDAMPQIIKVGSTEYSISIYTINDKWAVDYCSETDADIQTEECDCLIDAAYSRLCWCIENGYVKKARRHKNKEQ